MISDKWIDDLDMISDKLQDYVESARIVHCLSTSENLWAKITLMGDNVSDTPFELGIDQRMRDVLIKGVCTILEGDRAKLLKLGFDPEKLTDAAKWNS